MDTCSLQLFSFSQLACLTDCSLTLCFNSPQSPTKRFMKSILLRITDILFSGHKSTALSFSLELLVFYLVCSIGKTLLFLVASIKNRPWTIVQGTKHRCYDGWKHRQQLAWLCPKIKSSCTWAPLFRLPITDIVIAHCWVYHSCISLCKINHIKLPKLQQMHSNSIVILLHNSCEVCEVNKEIK